MATTRDIISFLFSTNLSTDRIISIHRLWRNSRAAENSVIKDFDRLRVHDWNDSEISTLVNNKSQNFQSKNCV